MQTHSKKTDWSQALSKDRRRTVLITFLPALLMMGVIFFFSAQCGEDSSKESGKIVEILLFLIKHLPHGAQLTEDPLTLAETLSYPVRKCAHMTEFGVLALCFFMGIYNLVKWYPYIPAFLCTFVYAMSDEFHQNFVPGRHASLIDVTIDCTGALIALVLLHIILKIRRKRNGRKRNQE